MKKATNYCKKLGLNLIAAAIAAFAATSQAGPVVVTPGSSAGYLYFPPAAVSGGAGSGGSEFHAIRGDCEKAENIGESCSWGDGANMRLAGKSGVKKYFFTGLEATKSASCTQVSANQSGVQNTTLIASCSQQASTCLSKGSGYYLPNTGELSIIIANRASLGISGIVGTSTTAMTSDAMSYGIVVYNNGFSAYGNPSINSQFICVRSY